MNAQLVTPEPWSILSGGLFLRIIINFIFIFLLVRVVYYRNNKRTDLFFTFLSFNLIIFFVSFLLQETGFSTGAGFGLFAIFSLIRYRTEGIQVRDMTYLFLSISIGLISAVSPHLYTMLPLSLAIILIFTFLVESDLFYRREYLRCVKYDKIDLIRKQDERAMIEDLKVRTGLDIARIQIGEVDFLKKVCDVNIYYYEK